MFDSTFYIDYIKVYIDGQHSVAYIDQHYDDPESPLVFKDGKYDLPDWIEPFNPQNIYSCFELIEGLLFSYKEPIPFSPMNIYSPFEIGLDTFPYVQELAEPFNTYNIYSQTYTAIDILPTTYSLILPINYNGIYSIFQIAENNFCCTEGNYPVPFDQYGLYSVFSVQKKFYNLPAVRRDIVDPIPEIQEDWRRLDPQYVENYLNVSVSNFTHSINSLPTHPYVKDRDLHWADYREYQDIYNEFES